MSDAVGRSGGAAERPSASNVEEGRDTVQVTVNLSRDAYETLERIAGEQNMSVTEALHRAIASLAFFVENEGKVLVDPGRGRAPRAVSFTR